MIRLESVMEGKKGMLAGDIYALVEISGTYVFTLLFLDVNVKRMNEPQIETEFSDQFEIRQGKYDAPNRQL